MSWLCASPAGEFIQFLLYLQGEITQVSKKKRDDIRLLY